MSSVPDPSGLFVRRHLLESANVKQRTADICSPAILEAADLIASSFTNGCKLLLCGNGGSAADCQHMAAEFTSRLSADFRRPGLPALALTTDTSFLTGYANDYDFDGVFARQIQALGKAGDVLIAISTSGNSQNVIEGVEFAKSAGIASIGLNGAGGGRLREVADVCICVPSANGLVEEKLKFRDLGRAQFWSWHWKVVSATALRALGGCQPLSLQEFALLDFDELDAYAAPMAAVFGLDDVLVAIRRHRNPKTRQVLTDLVLQLSLAESAEFRGLTVADVWRTRKRGREQLRELLLGDEFDHSSD